MNHIDVHPRILTALKKAKLKDFFPLLTLSAADVQRLTRLSATDVTNLQAAIAESIPRRSCLSALQMLKRDCRDELQRTYLSTGCEVLDQFLRGGVITSGLTEIAGESASGKTQLCLQLCLTVQRPLDCGGLDSGAVYICTEDAFPNRRLVQMASLLRQRHPQLLSDGRSLTDRIYVEHAADVDDLHNCVSRKVAALLESGRIKLIVIDSIAGLFRGDLESEQPAAARTLFTADFFVKRAKRLGSLAGLLHRLSFQYNAAVVVVNQVSDFFGDTRSDRIRLSQDKTPALGLTWANTLTVRLMMSRTNESVTLPLGNSRESPSRPSTSSSAAVAHQVSAKTYQATVRALEVAFAPHLPNSVCRIVIDEEGVKGRA